MYLTHAMDPFRDGALAARAVSNRKTLFLPPAFGTDGTTSVLECKIRLRDGKGGGSEPCDDPYGPFRVTCWASAHRPGARISSLLCPKPLRPRRVSLWEVAFVRSSFIWRLDGRFGQHTSTLSECSSPSSLLIQTLALIVPLELDSHNLSLLMPLELDSHNLSLLVPLELDSYNLSLIVPLELDFHILSLIVPLELDFHNLSLLICHAFLFFYLSARRSPFFFFHVIFPPFLPSIQLEGVKIRSLEEYEKRLYSPFDTEEEVGFEPPPPPPP